MSTSGAMNTATQMIFKSSTKYAFGCMWLYLLSPCHNFMIYFHISLITILQVDTEVCEQVFSWMSKYARITQHMNRQHFLFYLLYLCDSRNRMYSKSLNIIVHSLTCIVHVLSVKRVYLDIYTRSITIIIIIMCLFVITIALLFPAPFLSVNIHMYWVASMHNLRQIG